MGWIKDEERWLELLESRNMTSHTYDQEMAMDVYEDTIENSSENALILWWCALVRTFVQFVPFVAIRDLLVLILSRMSRINEWHESSKSAEITGFLDSVVYETVKENFQAFGSLLRELREEIDR